MKGLFIRLLPILLTVVSAAPMHAADSALLAAVKKEEAKPDPFSVIGVYRALKRSEYPVPRP